MDEANRTLRSAFSGETAGLVFENEKRFDLVVRLDERKRKSLDDIKAVYVNKEGGAQIRVEQIAEIALEGGPNQIQPEDAMRRVAIGIKVGGRNVQRIMRERVQKLFGG